MEDDGERSAFFGNVFSGALQCGKEGLMAVLSVDIQFKGAGDVSAAVVVLLGMRQGTRQ